MTRWSDALGRLWFGESGAGSRWRALDQLRALAVILMVQGHTFTALLREGEFSATFSRVHSVLHGLTAPTFLFGAGLAFGTATYGHYDQHRTLGGPLGKRLGRYAMLLSIGYLLQLPGGSALATLDVHGKQLASLCRVGPLQLIAIVLGLCQLAILVVRDPRAHAACALALGMITLTLATPIARSGVAAELGVFWGAFLDDRGGAHFPIFPWATYVLFGVGCAGMLRGRALKLRPLPLTALGVVLAVAAYARFQANGRELGEAFFWRTSPSYLLFRLGLVVSLLGVLHFWRGGGKQAQQGDSWSAVLSRQSLVAYVGHLLMLYGTPLSPGLSSLGKSLDLAQTSLVFAVVLAATLLATQLWDRRKRFARGAASARLGQRGAGAEPIVVVSPDPSGPP